MNQAENINAPKVNTFIPHGMTGKLFTGGALCFNSMKRTKFPQKISGIYQIQSKVNDKIYVGSTSNLKIRKKDHLKFLKNKGHINRHLQNHVNKHGIDKLTFSTLEFCPKEKLIEREQYYINVLKPEFNICKVAHSTLGIKYTKESRKKLSASQLIRFQNPEEIIKLKEAWKTREPDSEETIKKKRKATQGKNNGMYGKHHSKETRQKISKANKGEKSVWYGKKHTEKTKRKMSNTWEKKSEITCPYCKVKGKDNVMYRWHFKNCKYKDEAVADALAIHYTAMRMSSTLKLFKNK